MILVVNGYNHCVYLYGQHEGSILCHQPGGVRTKTAMHYFDEFPTWRNFVVMRAVFRVSLIIVCTTFAGLFSATILDLESSGIVK